MVVARSIGSTSWNATSARAGWGDRVLERPSNTPSGTTSVAAPDHPARCSTWWLDADAGTTTWRTSRPASSASATSTGPSTTYVASSYRKPLSRSSLRIRWMRGLRPETSSVI